MHKNLAFIKERHSMYTSSQSLAWLLTLFTIIRSCHLSSTTTQPPQCPAEINNGCSCEATLLEIRCIDTGLISIPENLPPYLKRLELTGNHIDEVLNVAYLEVERLVLHQNEIRYIGDDSFKNLHELNELELNDNLISGIKANTFHGLNKLTHLDLTNNRLFEIERQTFTGAILPELSYLNLANCRIYVFQPDAVNNVTSLQLLNISHNYLKDILPFGNSLGFPNLTKLDLSFNQLTLASAESIFIGMPSLQSLYLHHNKIEFLENHTFHGLGRSLEFLYLEQNNIKLINHEAFDDLVALKVLDISHNLVVVLEPNHLLSGHLEQLLVHHNPWRCDCVNAWMKNQPKVEAWNDNVTLRCSQPLRYNNMSVMEVPLSAFQSCSSDTDTKHSNTTFAAVLVVVTVVVLLGFIGMIIWFKRRKRSSEGIANSSTSLSYHRMGHLTGDAFSIVGREED